MQRLAFKSLNFKPDYFFWKYLRLSTWYKGELRERHGRFSPEDRCQEKLSKDVAFVNIHPTSGGALLTRMERRYSMVDRAAILGGTLALWLGFSIMSLLEVAYWLYMFLTSFGKG